MTFKRTAEFSCSGNKLSTDELRQILTEAQKMGADHVIIDQTKYNEPPYGTSVTTKVTINQGKTLASGEGY